MMDQSLKDKFMQQMTSYMKDLNMLKRQMLVEKYDDIRQSYMLSVIHKVAGLCLTFEFKEEGNIARYVEMRLDSAFKSQKVHEVKACEVLVVNLVKSCEEILEDWESYANHFDGKEEEDLENEFASLKGVKVVIADDDPVIRAIMIRQLENKNIHVEVAKNGLEALNTILSTKPNFIVLDENMPEMNGSDVCRELLNYPEMNAVPVFLVSGYDSGELHDLHGLTNLKKVFEKPLKIDNLLSELNQLI